MTYQYNRNARALCTVKPITMSERLFTDMMAFFKFLFHKNENMTALATIKNNFYHVN